MTHTTTWIRTDVDLRWLAAAIFTGLFVPTMSGLQCWFELGVGQ
jgi:hypothetical protein